jgi:hypothetical protein
MGSNGHICISQRLPYLCNGADPSHQCAQHNLPRCMLWESSRIWEPTWSTQLKRPQKEWVPICAGKFRSAPKTGRSQHTELQPTQYLSTPTPALHLVADLTTHPIPSS